VWEYAWENQEPANATEAAAHDVLAICGAGSKL
jgi:hypothetical protein